VPLSADIVSPERVLYTGEADMVVCRTSEGEIAFLPGHVPFLGALGTGVVRILLPQEGEQAAAVHGGFVEVANDRVIVLSDVAELAEGIDVDRARRARQRAEERLSADPVDDDAQAALLRATTRLEVAGAAEHA
jgi:F-type H+-transporting ATPase subunit epsilon